jgi:hypothetical protein
MNPNFEPIQQEELDRLNQAIASQTLSPIDEKMLRKKYFNPQTGELTLLVANESNDGVRMASVNLFE